MDNLNYARRIRQDSFSRKLNAFYEYPEHSGNAVLAQAIMLPEFRVGYSEPESDGRIKMPGIYTVCGDIPLGKPLAVKLEDIPSLPNGDTMQVNNLEEIAWAREAHRVNYLSQFSQLKDELIKMWTRAQDKKYGGNIIYKFVNSWVSKRVGSKEHTQLVGGILYPQILIGFPVQSTIERAREEDLTGQEIATRSAIQIWDVTVPKYSGKYALGKHDKKTLEENRRRGNFHHASVGSEVELTTQTEVHKREFAHSLHPLKHEMGEAFNEFARENPHLFQSNKVLQHQ